MKKYKIVYKEFVVVDFPNMKLSQETYDSVGLTLDGAKERLQMIAEECQRKNTFRFIHVVADVGITYSDEEKFYTWEIVEATETNVETQGTYV